MRNTLALLFFLFIGIPLFMFLLWYFQPKKKINIIIVDKTVVKKKGNEHNSFNWVLNHNRFVKENNESYKISEDYWGFFPKKNYKFDINDIDQFSDFQLDSISRKTDAIYITDVYGIYYNDWFQRGTSVLERSKKIYGGLSKSDFQLMKKMKDQHKLILSEFNLIASPTSDDNRQRVENEFHIKWSGWTGRYFESLDSIENKELPKWVTELFMDENDGEWPFSKAGIVLVNNNNSICVLEADYHLQSDVPIIETKFREQEFYSVPEKMKYPFWFDIMYTDSTNDIVSNYRIETNSEGDSVLKHFGLKNVFPAVLRHKKTDYEFYYFAGDFSDNPIQNETAYFKGIRKISFLLETGEESDRRSFFWNYYTPMLSKIMLDREEHNRLERSAKD